MKKSTIIFHDLAGVYLYSYPLFAVAGFALLKDAWNMTELLRLHTLLWIPGYLYFLRRNVGSVLIRILLQMVIFVGAYVYSVDKTPGVPGPVIILLAAFYFFSLMLYSAELVLETSTGVLGFFGCMLMILYIASEERELQYYMIFAAVVLLIIYLADMHFFNMNRTLENSQQMLQHSMGQTKRRNYIIFLGILAIMTLAALLALGLGAAELLESMFANVLKWIAGLFKTEKEPMEELILESSLIEKNRIGMDGEAVIPSDAIWTVFTYVLIGIAVVAVLLLLIQYFRNRTEEKRGDYFEEKSTFVEKKKRPDRILRLWGRSNEARIRQIYCQWVEKLAKQGMRLHHSDTAGQINERVEKTSFAEMTKLFEKARYSGTAITDAELGQMKRNAEVLKAQNVDNSY